MEKRGIESAAPRLVVCRLIHNIRANPHLVCTKWMEVVNVSKRETPEYPFSGVQEISRSRKIIN